jgi:hypothetical protein
MALPLLRVMSNNDTLPRRVWLWSCGWSRGQSSILNRSPDHSSRDARIQVISSGDSFSKWPFGVLTGIVSEVPLSRIFFKKTPFKEDTMSKDVYEKLAAHLDKLPAGFPPSPSGVELRLLKRLFTAEEAKLAAHLTLNREEAGAIAHRAKLVLGKAEQVLREMARKGLIFSIETKGAPTLYQAVPWIVGIYEFQVNNPDESFFQDVNEYFSTRRQASRPQPIPQMRTIPIARSIEPQLEVLPYERAEECQDP